MSDLLRANCPICGLKDQRVAYDVQNDSQRTKCERCGDFYLTDTALHQAQDAHVQPTLSAWIRSETDSGNPSPKVDSALIDAIIKDFSRLSPAEKQRLLLRSIEKHTTYPGHYVDLNPSLHYPLAWAANDQELTYLLQALQERNLIRQEETTVGLKVLITPDGWNFIEKDNRPNIHSDQAFIAMNFCDSLKDIWTDAIKPAVERAGFKAYRVDVDPHLDKIDAKIMAEIKRSRFLIADVTGDRSGVYFEAGYATGLGIPVIWSVDSKEIDHVHFDTRQYNHILWSDREKFCEDLYYRIVANFHL